MPLSRHTFGTKAAAIGAGIACLVLAGVTVTPGALAEPPRFEVRDADSTLTLFGTVHILRPETNWRGAGFDKAFRGADEVWFEIVPGSDNDPQLLEAIRRSGFDPATPLNKKLSPAEYKKFEAAAASLGMQLDRLNVLRPWLASLQLSLASVQKAGYQPNSGVEEVLEKEIGTRPVKAFETAIEQLSFFAGLSPDLEKAVLLETIGEVQAGAGQLDQLVRLWQAGDLAALDRLVNRDLRQDYPALYDVVLRRRNLAWVERIKAEMAGSGTDFIAVGAGHLVGADGVPELLRKAGFTVVQVSTSPTAKTGKQPKKPVKPGK